MAPEAPLSPRARTPEGDRRSDVLFDAALDWAKTSVFRVIVTRLIPLLMGTTIVAMVLAKAQDWIGLDLPPAEVAAFLTAMVLGVAAKAFEYVRNFGRGQSAVLTTMIDVLGAGRREADQLRDTVTPPAPAPPVRPLPETGRR